MIDTPASATSRIAPKAVRYIKLGPGGAWEKASIDGGRIDWGNADDPHEVALAERWEEARLTYLAQGRPPSTATGYTRELKEFYTLGPDTVWVTFARGSLWWAFAEVKVVLTSGATEQQGSRYRPTLGPWCNTDIHGRPLTMDRLSTKLTQLASYQRTICAVGAADYLIRRINGEEEPAVQAARGARRTLVGATIDLIRQLHWADFELFVDLIFARAGWRRVSALGGTMKDIDLLIEQPATGERASVQVKSSADQAVLDDCLAAFQASTATNRFFFVCHSPRGTLAVAEAPYRPVQIWTADRLAEAAVDQGLTSWLIDRAS